MYRQRHDEACTVLGVRYVNCALQTLDGRTAYGQSEAGAAEAGPSGEKWLEDVRDDVGRNAATAIFNHNPNERRRLSIPLYAYADEVLHPWRGTRGRLVERSRSQNCIVTVRQQVYENLFELDPTALQFARDICLDDQIYAVDPELLFVHPDGGMYRVRKLGDFDDIPILPDQRTKTLEDAPRAMDILDRFGDARQDIFSRRVPVDERLQIRKPKPDHI